MIKTTAQLALKLVEDSARRPARRCSQGTGGKVPDNMEIVSGPGRHARASRSSTCCAREAVITGRDLKNARVGRRREQPPDDPVHR